MCSVHTSVSFYKRKPYEYREEITCYTIPMSVQRAHTQIYECGVAVGMGRVCVLVNCIFLIRSPSVCNDALCARVFVFRSIELNLKWHTDGNKNETDIDKVLLFAVNRISVLVGDKSLFCKISEMRFFRKETHEQKRVDVMLGACWDAQKIRFMALYAAVCCMYSTLLWMRFVRYILRFHNAEYVDII